MVSVALGAPPEVVNIGVGVHGTSGLRDVFRLPDLWQLHLYGYSAALEVGGVSYDIRPGYVSVVPADTEVVYRYQGRSEHLFAHLQPGSAAPVVELPLMQDAGAETPVLSSLFRGALEASASSSARVSAEIWAVLWRVAGLAVPADRPHAAVATALAYVESHLAGPIAVPELARVAGSPTTT